MEKRLEKEREERRESSKLLYELERILKHQDPDCKVMGEDSLSGMISSVHMIMLIVSFGSLVTRYIS